jgi:glycopeptide antibiotics resistance protein
MKHVHARASARVIGLIALSIYVGFLGYLVFFSSEFGRDAPHLSQYNLVPFKTITNFIKYHEYVNFQTLMVNILGNVVAFVPFGVIMPIVFKKKEAYYYFHIVVIWAFLLSLTIEVTQIVMSVGAFDVDDLILNTFGAIIGYLVFLYFRRGYRRAVINKKRDRNGR